MISAYDPNFIASILQADIDPPEASFDNIDDMLKFLNDAKPENPSEVMISARDLKEIIRGELFDLQAKLKDHDDLPSERIKEIAKTIVERALLVPR